MHVSYDCCQSCRYRAQERMNRLLQESFAIHA